MILPDPDGGPRVDTVAFFNAPAEVMARHQHGGAWWRRPLHHPRWPTRAETLRGLDASTAGRACAWVPITPEWCTLFTAGGGPNANDVAWDPPAAASDPGVLSVFARVSLGRDTAGPATGFGAYFPTPGKDMFGVTHRAIDCISDHGHWTFDEHGAPLPFEELDAYRAPRKRDRLTGDMVYRYLAAMGVPYDVEPAWSAAAVVTFRGLWRLPW